MCWTFQSGLYFKSASNANTYKLYEVNVWQVSSSIATPVSNYSSGNQVIDAFQVGKQEEGLDEYAQMPFIDVDYTPKRVTEK